MTEMDRDPQSGRFEETIPNSRIISAVRKQEPASTQGIADDLGIHRRSAQHRLDRLADSGPIQKKKIGNSLVWSLRSGTGHEQAFEAFADRLTDAFEDEVHEVILYGSVARGEAQGMSSDVDLMIVTETTAARETIYDPAYDIAVEVMLEHDVALSLNFKTKAEMEEQQDRAYIQTVLQEGRIHG